MYIRLSKNFYKKLTIMRPFFLKRILLFFLHRWNWLKVAFYSIYFLFLQISNNGALSFFDFIVITLIFFVAIGVIELCQYALGLLFSERRYMRASFVFSGSYMMLATLGYYVIHGNENHMSTFMWNPEVEASWSAFLGGFNRFYWTFFKYGVILFLLKKILHSIKSRKIPRDDMNSGKSTDLAQENMTLTVKSGITTYMVNIFRIVYLEVKDEITTVYLIDGPPLEVKISLTKFFEQLPKNRFVRIHDSWVVALPYIAREAQGYIYMNNYNDKPLKLGKPERFSEYKKWRDDNKLK